MNAGGGKKVEAELQRDECVGEYEETLLWKTSVASVEACRDASKSLTVLTDWQ